MLMACNSFSIHARWNGPAGPAKAGPLFTQLQFFFSLFLFVCLFFFFFLAVKLPCKLPRATHVISLKCPNSLHSVTAMLFARLATLTEWVVSLVPAPVPLEDSSVGIRSLSCTAITARALEHVQLVLAAASTLAYEHKLRSLNN